MSDIFEAADNTLKRNLILDLLEKGDISTEVAVKRLGISAAVLEDMAIERSFFYMPVVLPATFDPGPNDGNYLWEDRAEILRNLFYENDKQTGINAFADFISRFSAYVYHSVGSNNLLKVCSTYIKMICWYCIEYCPDLFQPDLFKKLLSVETDSEISIIEAFLKEMNKRNVEARCLEYYKGFAKESTETKQLIKRRVGYAYDKMTFGITVCPPQKKLSPMKEYIISRAINRMRNTLCDFVEKGMMTEDEASINLKKAEDELREKLRKEDLTISID